MKEKELDIIRCTSEQNSADIFTKNIPREIFERHSSTIEIRSIEIFS